MRSWLGIAFALIYSATSGFAGPSANGPSRVVSMNLCTDQLAMMLAGPGQLASVSYIARDRRASAMAQDAMAYPINHGRAEEIYLLKPDLVIAGTFSTRATTDMLRRFGVPVAVFEPAYSLNDISDRIAQMGAVLGQDAAATALIALFEAEIANISGVAGRPRAALYAANGYTSGQHSLAGQILEAAGFANIAAELGYSHSGVLPLELLAMADPDVVIATRPYERPSRSEEILAHPVVSALSRHPDTGEMRDADWVCGTPHVLNAIQKLRHLHSDTTSPEEGSE